ncbi:uncharacterized protein LOC143425639 [Xylocopa sonorina]|uniref:uncharacterized protein LOC143425639 n=1 Tax=Xylocopa sonorina TaxID=1818115 RepID=UPI00403AD803
MTPYLTRKRASSNSEKQNKDKASFSKVVPKTKHAADEAPKVKSATNSKSSTRVRTTRNKKNNDSFLQSGTKQSARSKKLLDISNDKVKLTKATAVSNTSIIKKTSKDGKKKVIIRTSKNVSNSKQMSLKESFLNQSKRVLRSHKNVKNSESEMLTKKLNDNAKKPPVYERVSPDSHTDSGSEIYEFKFDVNDSTERLGRKRKKKNTVKKTVNRKKRIFPIKYNSQDHKVNVKKLATNKIGENKRTDGICIESENKNTTKPSNERKKSVDSLNKNRNCTELVDDYKDCVQPVNESKNSIQPVNENENSIQPVNENENSIQSCEKQNLELKSNLIENLKTDVQLNKHLEDRESTTKEAADNTIPTVDITVPTIISVEHITDKKITVINSSQVSNSNNLKPIMPTNILNNKLSVPQKNVLNYSLFEKSLSPIMKKDENLQTSSPWRASPLLTFSQVKNVFQSTPQNNEYDITKKNFVRPLINEPKHLGSITKIRSILQKNNENISPEKWTITNTPKKKNSLTSRKFGTEITNIDHSLQSKLSIEQTNDWVPTEIEHTLPNVPTINTVTSNMSNALQSHSNKNKKNNVLSPVKSPKMKTMEISSQIHQKDISNVQFDNQKENFDPQPGPSGLQNCNMTNKQIGLRQLNLNNFLNIPEMPQSITIRTHHGIFDDAKPKSITSKSSKFNESHVELKNAFGFNDDNSDQEVCIRDHKIKDDGKAKTVESNVTLHNVKPTARLSVDEIKSKLLAKKSEDDGKPKIVESNLTLHNVKPTARLSIGEIKSKLLAKKSENDTYDKENIITEKKEIKRLFDKKRDKQKIDITNFSDTFDILSEAGETSVASVSDVPLFADFEPSHFTEPPRHSYKRKREVRFSFSEEEDEEEEKRTSEHETKRKKTGKLKKRQEKRLKEWVQDINKIFSEIDKHELVIE